MKIVFTITDEENGHVRIDSRPPLHKLVEAYRKGDTTPSLVYAILGLAKMRSESERIATEEMAMQRDEMLRDKLIMPDPRKFQPHQTGPTIVS